MRSQVVNYVDMAFRMIGDLAKTITLVSNPTTQFNFSSGTAVMLPPVTTVIQGVIEKASKEDVDTYALKIMCKAKDISNPSLLSKITVDDVSYTVVHPHETDGYVTYIKAAKEIT